MCQHLYIFVSFWENPVQNTTNYHNFVSLSLVLPVSNIKTRAGADEAVELGHQELYAMVGEGGGFLEGRCSLPLE